MRQSLGPAVGVMDIERALSEISEVRDRLDRLQRFEGYSAAAAAASGVAALVAGGIQAVLAPLPVTLASFQAYLTIWIACLAVALLLNYGAVVIWLARNRRPSARRQFRTAAVSIAPGVVLGGALTLALARQHAYAMLPGVWFAFYALGLFASRDAIPRGTIGATLGFAVLAVLFLVTPLASVAPAWWVMPLGFGGGQLAIGYLIWQERDR